MSSRTRTLTPSLEKLVAASRQDLNSPTALADAAEMSFARLDRALMIPIERIAPMRDNPRQTFRKLDELAASIEAEGIVQPLVVRRDSERAGYYMTIAGARRVMAANILRGHEDPGVRGRVALLPCVVIEESEAGALAKALAENIARDDLTRGEMMDAVLRLQRDHGWSGNRIAKTIGRNQPDVAEMLRVAKDPELSMLVREEVVSASAAGEITRLPESARTQVISEIRAGRIRSRDDIKAVNPRRRTRHAPAPGHARGVSEVTNPTAVLATDGGSDVTTPCTPPDIPRPTGPGVRVRKPSPAEKRAEELRLAASHAEALRAIVEPHPLLAWEPEVRASLDAVYESREKLSGRASAEDGPSIEDDRLALARARDLIAGVMARRARVAGDEACRDLAEEIRADVDALLA